MPLWTPVAVLGLEHVSRTQETTTQLSRRTKMKGFLRRIRLASRGSTRSDAVKWNAFRPLATYAPQYCTADSFCHMRSVYVELCYQKFGQLDQIKVNECGWPAGDLLNSACGLNVCSRLTKSAPLIESNRLIRTRDIVFFIPCVLLLCQNQPPALPIMQLDCRQFGRRLRCVMLVAANVASGL